MNFTQMHERLRLELLRRIQRGTLSVSLLARQTGFGQSHLSNFLRCQRQLSLEAMDRILAAQRMAAADLLPGYIELPGKSDEIASIPVVSLSTAMHEPVIRSSAIQSVFHLPAAALRSIRTRVPVHRRNWERFVAVSLPVSESNAMDPLIQPESIALLDRHYISLAPYRSTRQNIYAVRHDSRLKVRYADFLTSRLVLRPHNRGVPVDLLELGPGESLSDLIVGRLAMILNEL